jgi:hypothetical protein
MENKEENKIEEKKVYQNSFLSMIQNKLNDQDFLQKNNSIILFCLELYRVLVSSLLILFVPQACGPESNVHVCSYEENMAPTSNLYTAGLVVNFITMGSLFFMYLFEINREYKLINYLEVNSSKPCDNESVGKALSTLPKHRAQNILFLDKYYYRFAMLSILLFITNTILSGFVIYDFYLDNQTTTTFVTNVLFMITKLTDVYSTINTPKNIFYSAYLKGKIQYNDVDPEKSESFRTLDCVTKEKIEEEDIKIEITHSTHSTNSTNSTNVELVETKEDQNV